MSTKFHETVLFHFHEKLHPTQYDYATYCHYNNAIFLRSNNKFYSVVSLAKSNSTNTNSYTCKPELILKEENVRW